MKRFEACTALTGLGALLVSTPVAASGFMVRENSAAAIATAFAGIGSRGDTAATVFNNPAGMVLLSRNEVEISTTAMLPSVRFTGGASVLGTSIPGDNGGNGARDGLIPNQHWAFAIANRLKGGIAVTVPFGNAAEYTSTWSGRYLGIKTSVSSADINPNIAYRLTDAVSIGAGISAQYLRLESTRANSPKRESRGIPEASEL